MVTTMDGIDCLVEASTLWISHNPDVVFAKLMNNTRESLIECHGRRIDCDCDHDHYHDGDSLQYLTDNCMIFSSDRKTKVGWLSMFRSSLDTANS